MKHRIISTTIRMAAIVMAAVAAVACRVEDGSGDIDSTAVGYTLFNNANDAMQEFAQAIDRMQGLDLYISAADDATREAIRLASTLPPHAASEHSSITRPYSSTWPMSRRGTTSSMRYDSNHGRNNSVIVPRNLIVTPMLIRSA